MPFIVPCSYVEKPNYPLVSPGPSVPLTSGIHIFSLGHGGEGGSYESEQGVILQIALLSSYFPGAKSQLPSS